MKHLLFLFTVLFFHHSNAQLITTIDWSEKSSLPSSETIYYSAAKKLVWENFMGAVPEETGRVAAITASGFGYNAAIRSTGGKGRLIIAVYCYFTKNKSWVKPDKASPYVLTHEQHHFDISYLAANLFIQKLKSANFTNSNYNELLLKIYTECCDVMNIMQDDYDGETKNGQLKDIQQKWNEIVDEKLNAITK